jgi:hypothetical protein
MHVKMTRIESGVTVPKCLFTFYMNIKIVTAKNVLAAIVHVRKEAFIRGVVGAISAIYTSGRRTKCLRHFPETFGVMKTPVHIQEVAQNVINQF